MLVAVTCACGGVEQLVRKLFRKSGVKNWLDVPIYRDRSGFIKFQNSLPKNVQELDDFQVLKSVVNRGGSYVIIVGYNNNTIKCANIKSGHLSDRLKAEVIAETFA